MSQRRFPSVLNSVSKIHRSQHSVFDCCSITYNFRLLLCSVGMQGDVFRSCPHSNSANIINALRPPFFPSSLHLLLEIPGIPQSEISRASAYERTVAAQFNKQPFEHADQHSFHHPRPRTKTQLWLVCSTEVKAYRTGIPEGQMMRQCLTPILATFVVS